MRAWLPLLLTEARVVELRHLVEGRCDVGTFDNEAALVAAVRARAHVGNLYTTVNRVNDDVVAGNVMRHRARGLTDADFRMHTRLLFDFDAVRPAGVAATEAEVEAAVVMRNRFMGTLLAMGWPAPALGRSGNGAHLVYRLRLPVADDVKEMFDALYLGLKPEFSDAAVTFDSTVRNPSRIWRCYGEMNRKGDPTIDRPHRRALITIPSLWEAVSPRAVAALADAYARRAPPAPRVPRTSMPVVGRGAFSSLDVVEWFTAHGAYGRPLGGGKHSVRCPWVEEHSTPTAVADSSSVVWEAHEGVWPSFHCSHAHCEGRGIRDVMALWLDADRFCARPWAPSRRSP